jgi:hypothetical protein
MIFKFYIFMIFDKDFSSNYFDRQNFPLYVDEISPDNIKAVVSDAGSAHYNVLVIKMALFGSPWTRLGKYINGIMVMAVGQYVCINMKSTDNTRLSSGMILLDLKGSQEMAERMSEQFKDEALRNSFMEAFEEVLYYPEKHGKFRLVVGKPTVFGRRL